MTITFDTEEPLGKALQAWWEDLQQRKGDRAELCRAKTITDVLLLPAFHRACSRFKPFFQYESNWEDRLAAIIGLLAHVRQQPHLEKKLARQMAEGDPPVVSELRFRRLIQRDRADLYISMIRVLRMLDNKAKLDDLARSVYFWGDKIKRDWAFDYFPNIPDSKSR